MRGGRRGARRRCFGILRSHRGSPVRSLRSTSQRIANPLIPSRRLLRDVDAVDAGSARAHVAQSDEAVDCLLRPLEHRLDGSVTVVPDPAATPFAKAWRWTESRKKTPWTSPFTTTRRRIMGAERCRPDRPRRRPDRLTDGCSSDALDASRRRPSSSRTRRRTTARSARRAPPAPLPSSEAGRTETASGLHGRGSRRRSESEEARDVDVDGMRPELVGRRRLARLGRPA